MPSNKRGPKRGEAHVRLYGYELTTPAYRHLSTDARALLVEFRALFNGRENRIFMSVRQMVERLNVGQRRAQHARDELLRCGWIKVMERGAFTRKTKEATVYALCNEPLQAGDGAVASKEFMRWQPPQKQITVVTTTTDGSRHDYRDHETGPSKERFSSHHDYRKASKRQSTVVTTTTQIELPGGLHPRASGSEVPVARNSRTRP